MSIRVIRLSSSNKYSANALANSVLPTPVVPRKMKEPIGLCESFNPDYCRRQSSIAAQMEAGKQFFKDKYPDMRYVAYFQAYSSTYAPLDVLRQRYEEALSVKDVVGIVVATRPDCIDEQVIDLLVCIRNRGFSFFL